MANASSRHWSVTMFSPCPHPLDAHYAHVPVPVGERCLWSRQSLHVRMMHGSRLAKTRKRHADRHY